MRMGVEGRDNCLGREGNFLWQLGHMGVGCAEGEEMVGHVFRHALGHFPFTELIACERT